MEIDELLSQRGTDPLAMLVKQDLDPISVDELHARIALLKAEIIRVESKISQSTNQRATAEALFRR